MDTKELKSRLDIYKTPLDVEKYLDEGIISRYQNTKTQFISKIPLTELPQEISCRIQAIKALSKNESSHTLVMTLNLKVMK